MSGGQRSAARAPRVPGDLGGFLNGLRNRTVEMIRPVMGRPDPYGEAFLKGRSVPGLPTSARQVTQYPAGVSTGVGGGNAGASTSQWRGGGTRSNLLAPPAPFAGGQRPVAAQGSFAAASAPSISAGQVDQFQEAARAAAAYQEQVDGLKNRVGGDAGLNLIGEMPMMPNAGFAGPGMNTPTDLSLTDLYTAQNEVGKGRFSETNEEIDSVMNKLGYDEKMRQWAMANPMLAQREYARMAAKQAGAAPAPGTPVEEAVVN